MACAVSHLVKAFLVLNQFRNQNADPRKEKSQSPWERNLLMILSGQLKTIFVLQTDSLLLPFFVTFIKGAWIRLRQIMGEFKKFGYLPSLREH